MKVLVVGSGGREHALCWGIAKSPLCTKLYCAPGNAGIATLAECLPIMADKFADLIAACRKHSIDFVVIGPETPLALGLADELRAEGIICFGPSKLAAEIESSKGFMKDLVTQAGVPTAEFQRFTDVAAARGYIEKKGAPIVVKADGLAAGKGVVVAHTVEEALQAVDDMMIKNVFGASGAAVVIEEFMDGEEVSFFALCDGDIALPFAAAQDHKTAYDGDQGPNTGGMGAYSPAPLVDDTMQTRIMDEIISPTIKLMKKLGRPFSGVLFAGLMIANGRPRLIEFNVRFGDPETQAIIPRLKTDLLTLLYASGQGSLKGCQLAWHDKAALCVVLAAEGYPGTYKKGTRIDGLDEAGKVPDTLILHAGTEVDSSGQIIAVGGRVLGVTAWAKTIAEARKQAYQAVAAIKWPHGFCRKDIGWRAIKN